MRIPDVRSLGIGLLVLALTLYPLMPYSVVGLGLSPYQVLALLFVAVTGLMVLGRGELRINLVLILVVGFLVYISVHYMVTGPHSAYASGKFNAYAFGAVLALCIAQYRGVVRPVLLGVQMAFWSTVPFVLYSLHTFIVRRSLVTALPDLPGFTVSTGGWLAEGHNFQGFIRLSAPFPTPQFLGLLAAVAAFITLWQILKAPRGGAVRVFRYATLGVATFVVFGSLSRSAILPAVLWAGALFVAGAGNWRVVVRVVAPALVAVGVVVGLGEQIGIGNIAQVALDRAAAAPDDLGEHLRSRLVAVELWASTPTTVLVGTAFGEYGSLWAAADRNANSTYATMLPETGLVGTLLLGGIIALLWVRAVTSPSRSPLLAWVLAMIAFVFLLYDFLALQFIWALFGAAASLPGRMAGGMEPPAASPSSLAPRAAG